MALILESMSFATGERAAWIEGWKECDKNTERRLLKGLRPSFLTRFIAKKARVRPARFFGEAVVARTWGYEQAWYSSFKWLTVQRWTDDTRLTGDWQREFKHALGEHLPRLRALQPIACRLAVKGGFKPVAPDLWLIRDGVHYFLEAKLPGDALSEAQLAGLALLATCSPAKRRVRVGVVYLHEKGVPARPIPADVGRRFDEYCATIRRL